MIINPEVLDNYYVCRKKIMEYLLYECRLVPEGHKEGLYYFYKNEKLEECLKNMPLYLKIANIFIKKEK